MYYSRPIQFLLWVPVPHLPKSHLTALLRAGVRPHLIHFAISRNIVRYVSDIKHFIYSFLPELHTTTFRGKVDACNSSARVNPSACGPRGESCAMKGARRPECKVETFYLLPVFLQRRHGGEVAGVVDELKFLKDTVVRQDIHADAR